MLSSLQTTICASVALLSIPFLGIHQTITLSAASPLVSTLQQDHLVVALISPVLQLHQRTRARARVEREGKAVVPLRVLVVKARVAKVTRAVRVVVSSAPGLAWTASLPSMFCLMAVDHWTEVLVDPFRTLTATVAHEQLGQPQRPLRIDPQPNHQS